MRASAEMRSRARQLRAAVTLSERRLWNWVRNRSFSGFKFRRQVPVGRYVLDFYCPEVKLALEIDGAQHQTERMSDYDGERTTFLRSHFEIVRIANKLIAQDSLTAESVIREAIVARAKVLVRG